MNPFKLSVSHLQECNYVGDIISREELEQLENAQTILDDAKRKAEQIRAIAESELNTTRSDIQQMIQQAKVKAEKDAVLIAQEATDQAIADTIQWVVDEMSLEQRVAANMNERIRSLVAQAVTQYSAQQDVSEILVRRLSRPIEEQLSQGKVQLKVNSQVLPFIELKLSKVNGLELIADDSLSERQACLETMLVRMDLDLDRHLHSVLDNLVGEPKSHTCSSY
ncbi:hypothetical protein L4C34_02915 [Vibrio profundum]|uniref:hypothetical protein n=1 Tax=Vibrio profundum TaxID=2910247 RepID=UPI003D12B230